MIKEIFVMTVHVFDPSTFSLLISLRCQIHTELAKCEEDQEQIQVAMEHLVKVSGTSAYVKVRGSCNGLLLFIVCGIRIFLYCTCMKITMLLGDHVP